jgi:two-component system, cell cycle sensor histidine kinase and response regulator CckA
MTDKMNAGESSMAVSQILHQNVKEIVGVKDLFDLIFRIGPDAAMITRASDGLIYDCNERFLAISGYSRLEVLGKTTIELAIFENASDRQKVIEFLSKSGFCENMEFVLRMKNGDKLTGIISAQLISMDGVLHIYSLIRDITQRKLAEMALQESEEKFAKAFRTSIDAININRLSDGMYLEINQGFTNITGYMPEDVIGRSSLPGELGIWVNKEDRDRMVAGLAATGEVIGIEAPFRMKNGQIRIGSMSARILEINGERCILSTTRDITKQKEAEFALIASEQKYRELANTVPVGIFEFDHYGKLIFANKTLFDWFGYSEAEFKAGINIMDLADPNDQDRLKKNMAQILALKASPPREYSLVRKGGGIIQVLALTQPIMVHEEVQGFRGILLDLTEKKKVEIALQNAVKLDSLGILASGIAHDFNNLLAGIFSYIDLARIASKEPDVQAYLGATMQSMNRARGLTHQLLTFAKGGMPKKNTEALFPFIQDTVQFALSGSNVSCRFTSQEGLWAASFEKNQIGQVIDNIVINAQQAMPLGGVIAVLAVNLNLGKNDHPILQEGPYVKISVKDQGVGIPKEILPRIFDPFFTTKAKGHGLGLATCFSIISRHEGAIDVDSEQGAGTTFHIYLPAITEHISQTANVASVGHTGTGTFIIMDDEKLVCDAIAITLESFGYSCIRVHNGTDALQSFLKALRNHDKIAGIILDLTVPGGLGGKETVSEIRTLDKDVPIFVSSGYADDPIIASPESYGFNASIRKPFTTAQIAEMLNKHL